MKISKLIDRNYSNISVLEDTRDALVFLNDHEYLVVIDEDVNPIGIVTLKDLNAHPESRNLIDCNIRKPEVSPNQSILEVFHLMNECNCDFLPVYDNNQFIGVISIMKITLRFAQLLEENKQEYQKVIHDLRNPVSNLYGLINLLKDSVTDKEELDVIRLCNHSCKHAMDILDDLLIVEIDDNRPLSKVPTELNSFYKQCIDEQTGLSTLKQIEIVTDLIKTKVVKAIDRNQVKRAVQNVIANAIKFSYPNSTIKISSKKEGEHLILKILDTGMGIPNKFKNEIFEKFTSAGRLGTSGEPSTGLGLCFTKLCLEQHGGSIYFKSTEGKGSKFYIKL